MQDSILKKIANSCETPSYVFDLDALNQRIASLKDRLGGKAIICYAMKANPFLVAPLQETVEKFEVCSPGEFRICERSGLDISKVVLSGVYKNKADIQRVVHTYRDRLTYTVESIGQYRLLAACAREENTQLHLLVRLSSGNQFGVDKDTLEDILHDAANDPHVKIKGLQLYSGTQKRKVDQIAEELRMLDDYCAELETRFDMKFDELEFGPGLYVSYFNNEEEQDDIILDGFAEALQQVSFRGKIILEMGRFIASSCGLYLTSVVDCKETDGKKYCIVDGGINHVNYYGQTMAMRTPVIEQFPKRTGTPEKWNICGALCTVGDLLVKQLPLTEVQLGDMLVFKKIGAYSITEGIYLFLSRDLPCVYFYSDQDGLRKIRSAQPTDVINSAEE